MSDKTFEEFVKETIARKADGDGPTAQEAWNFLSAKLREAEAACAEMRLAIEGIDEWEWHEYTDPDRICPWCGSTERFGHLTECQRQKALAINPGAHLLAQLEVADELAEAIEYGANPFAGSDWEPTMARALEAYRNLRPRQPEKLREAK